MVSQQYQKSVSVMYVCLDRFNDQFHHIIKLSLLLDHVWGSRPTHVPDVIDPKIVKNHGVPVIVFHFACDMASDVLINFGIFLFVQWSARVNQKAD